jgi:hypothetical protein
VVVNALLGHFSWLLAAALVVCPPEAEVVAADAIRRAFMLPSLLSPPDSLERRTRPRSADSPALALDVAKI